MYGQDWLLTAGQEEGLSQVKNLFKTLPKQNKIQMKNYLHLTKVVMINVQVSRCSAGDGRLVWNFPIDISLKVSQGSIASKKTIDISPQPVIHKVTHSKPNKKSNLHSEK